MNISHISPLVDRWSYFIFYFFLIRNIIPNLFFTAWPEIMLPTDCGGSRDDPEDQHYFEPSLFDEPRGADPEPPRVSRPDDVHAAFLAANLLLLYLNLARLSTINDAHPALPSPAATVREDRDDDNKWVNLFFYCSLRLPSLPPPSWCFALRFARPSRRIKVRVGVGGACVRVDLHGGVMVN